MSDNWRRQHTRIPIKTLLSALSKFVVHIIDRKRHERIIASTLIEVSTEPGVRYAQRPEIMNAIETVKINSTM